MPGSVTRAVRPPTMWAWLPVLGWCALIFAFSSVPSLSSGLGTWDVVLRKGAHVSEYAVLGALLVRATGVRAVALGAGIAYACSDEIHQTFVEGRHGAVLDVGIDTIGLAVGIAVYEVVRRRFAR